MQSVAPFMVHHTPPAAGAVQIRRLTNDPQQEYYTYVPASGGSGRPVFVAVHGVNRMAKDHAREFAGFAEVHDVVLVAPLFPKDRYSDYQRLGRSKKSARADLALKKIIEEVGFQTGADTGSIFMFGYSGGGQFVHRYAMAYPENVKRIVAAAPGWYTFPDYTARFPFGLKRVKRLGNAAFDPARFLSIPTCVMVGGKDLGRNGEFNTSDYLDQVQGINRLERGRNWIRAMKKAARTRKLETRFEFRILTGCGHSFLNCMRKGRMGEQVFHFLFHSTRFYCALN